MIASFVRAQDFSVTDSDGLLRAKARATEKKAYKVVVTTKDKTVVDLVSKGNYNWKSKENLSISGNKLIFSNVPIGLWQISGKSSDIKSVELLE
jgi:hypothetical protein